MEIIKQTDVHTPLSAVTLENGVMLLIFCDYALGSDGRKYYEVCKVKTFYDEVYDFEDEEYITLGWSADVDAHVVIRE